LIAFGQALRGRVVERRDRPEASAHGDGTGRPRNITITSSTLLWPSHGFDLPVLIHDAIRVFSTGLAALVTVALIQRLAILEAK
jgi:hypothetical protein